MEGVHNVYQKGFDFAKERYYPTSIQHFIYIIIYLLITYYISDYFLNFKLIRWIYIGTLIVAIATLYHEPYQTDQRNKKIAKDLFRLATI
jgi:4-hydroxybenzoate polyprenyltransferase